MPTTPLIQTTDGLPPIRSAEELLADTSLKFPKEIVKGTLHRGTKGVLVGPSKVGKSWAALGLGMSVATGTAWVNRKTAKGKVLYVNWEIMEVAFADRIRQVRQAMIEEHGELEFDNFEVETMRGTQVPFGEYIEKLIVRLEGKNYALIIIDPFYKGMVGKDENRASSVNPMCALLDKLAKCTGAAVLLVHHYPKGKQSDKPIIDRLAGSGVIARDADTIIAFTEHQHDNCLTMEFVLRNFAEQPAVVVERKFPRLVIRKDLDPTEVQGAKGAAKAERAEPLIQLLDQPGGLTTTQWKEQAKVKLGIPHATFFRDMKKLVEAGKAKQQEESKHWWTPPKK